MFKLSMPLSVSLYITTVFFAFIMFRNDASSSVVVLGSSQSAEQDTQLVSSPFNSSYGYEHLTVLL